ncbi:MAG: outer membrane beta-barrel protein [Nitrospiraceae bacterium]
MSASRSLVVAALLACAQVLAVPRGSFGESRAEHATDWRYGVFVDTAYTVDFNFPENHLWRSRSTTRRVNELDVNMAYGYVKKDAAEASRWGLEFAVQDGYDSQNFAFAQGEPNVGGADTLRRFGRANVSYLAPVGNGLTVTAGLFNSLIGYESLYSRSNLNYTRAWISENSPYAMFGVSARYPFSHEWAAAFYVINGYAYLSRPNDLPSYGGQVQWTPTPRVTVTQNVYFGPDQNNTAIRFWRLFSDSNVQWKNEDVTVALSYDVGTEDFAGDPNHPRTFWMGSALFTRWHVAGPWSVAVRPEFYWDRNGRLTGSQQLLVATTSTLEYRLVFRKLTGLLRVEYRFDQSSGPGGGFFRGGEIAPGVIGLNQNQHILIFGLVWSFDS